MRNTHKIEFKIYGEEMQFVEIEPDPGETVIGEPGSMLMMDEHIDMKTIFGDGSGQDQRLFGGNRLLLDDRIMSRAGSYGGKEEGSMLGGLSKVLDGDGW